MPVDLAAAAALHRQTRSLDEAYGDTSNFTTTDLGMAGDLLAGPCVTSSHARRGEV
jgi:hypothetical protein